MSINIEKIGLSVLNALIVPYIAFLMIFFGWFFSIWLIPSIPLVILIVIDAIYLFIRKEFKPIGIGILVGLILSVISYFLSYWLLGGILLLG